MDTKFWVNVLVDKIRFPMKTYKRSTYNLAELTLSI